MHRQWRGGTLESLARELRALRVTVEADYRVGSCALHNIQTCLRNTIQDVFGEGGKDINGNFKVNAMQLLHGLYNLVNYIKNDVLKRMWEEACVRTGKKKKYHVMSAPILTRWWYVGKQACEVEEDWSEWQIVMEFILKTCHLGNSGTTSAIKDIAKANHGIMKVTEITLDVTIIKCIHKVWVFPHFKFVQGGDPLTGDVAGYQARLMLLRFYLLWEDLDALLNDGWKQNEEFKTVVSEAADNLKEKSKEKIEHMLRICLLYLEKHFKQWCNEHLPFGLFAESDSARVVARIILDHPPLSEPATFKSHHHDRVINLVKFDALVWKRWVKKEEVRVQKL